MFIAFLNFPEVIIFYFIAFLRVSPSSQGAHQGAHVIFLMSLLFLHLTLLESSRIFKELKVLKVLNMSPACVDPGPSPGEMARTETPFLAENSPSTIDIWQFPHG
jgi:hypothetical protein